ncbi:MAG: bifunctional folylpolyglutamate synthase/dihydrofolate synthase [Helicobacteraceae bacterium]|jgi:dihydrofolate synthase/folylpolyglutamate synthase|nr:bifunctional folylpolyglutamate synthase/dihydrofolate synthase [Helicobacteraceae bacterium]
MKEFLARKGEAYTNINIDRMPRLWRERGNRFFLPKIIHIIGTNGKGSTGRILAKFLVDHGFKTLHYSSPHIFDINERFWLNGADITDDELNKAHLDTLKTIGEELADELSYFEYATAIAATLLRGCDYGVIEAGLGGEYDATAVLPASLMLVTPIGYDHQAILGESIEAIASTKLRAARSPTIIAKQNSARVYEIAARIVKERGFELFRAEDISPGIKEFTDNKAPPFMAINRQLAFAAAVFLGLNPSVSAFLINPLLGRMTQIAPNITIDAGHNLSAAEAVREAFGDKQAHLIYNCFQDKPFGRILETLKPIIKDVLILRLTHPRAAREEELLNAAKGLGVGCSYFNGRLEEGELYLVFGGFGVIEAFLRAYGAR